MTILDLLFAVVGLLLALAAPGFFGLRAIAPKSRDLAETLAFSVVGSVAVTILVGSALGFAGMFRREPLLAALALATAALAVAAWLRGGLGGAATEEPPGPEADELRHASRLRSEEAIARARGDAAGAEAADREARGMEAALDRRRGGE